MKTHLDTSLLLATLLLLPACASTPKTAYEGRGQPRSEAMIQDDLHIARVEKMARQRGIRVIWVNPHNRRVAGTVAASN